MTAANLSAAGPATSQSRKDLSIGDPRLDIRSLPGSDISAFSPALTFSREEADQTVELYERGLAKLMDWLRVEGLWQGR